MKSLVALALSFFCLFVLPQASNAQTKSRKNQLLPYADAEGYRVMSSVLDASTETSRSEPVSIFHRTVSERDFGDVRLQCSGSIPKEFQSALEGFDKKAKTKFVLQQEFSLRRKYRLIEAMVGIQTSTKGPPAGIYSVSAVGFDEKRTRAIVLVQYLVHPTGSVVLGGSTILYLLRKTQRGWQRATDIPECGQIY
jgi:hypothetical protein